VSLGNLLSRFVGGSRPPLIGFVYVPDEGPGLMAGAGVGASVRIPGKGPPWLVVDNSIESIVAARWPGRLLRVEITRLVQARDQLAHGGAPPPDSGYSRAAGVKVLEELPLHTLFGPHGDAVVRVIGAASALDETRARTLSEHRHAQAPDACERVWRAWLGDRKPPGVGDVVLHKTLMIPSRGLPVSPVNRGLAVTYGEVFRRAMAIAGDAAIEEDGDDVWLREPWRGASSALIDAALALGAPEHVGVEDRAILTQGWTRAFDA
jgi:hypothetical protein